jgi:alanine dehydrogenase
MTLPITPAAFEITKGARRVLTLSEAATQHCLDPAELLAALEEGFRGLEQGLVQAPPRQKLGVPGQGFALTMPSWKPGGPMAVKVVNVYEGNPAQGLPSHLAMILLFDAATGATLCVMDGTYITGLRTAAAAALSVRLLARRDARVATLVGAGAQAREHLRVLGLARGFERIQVWARQPAHAQALAALHPRAVAVHDLEAAVRGSDVVCLATGSATPVIDADWVRPGTHVTSVGFHPPAGELPVELAQRHRVFVESLNAFEPAPVGAGELAGLDAARGATLGALLLGRAEGRTADDQITVYKAMGHAMEDLVAATLAWESALKQGAGAGMDW